MSAVMSCPDWTRLVALREREEAEPAGWAAALAHLDACPRCRREAMAADPLLVFRRLPGAEAAERAEAEAMCQAVAAMRTARRLESRRSFAGWRRWAAAAALALASLTVAGRDRSPAVLTPAAPAPVASAVPAGTATLEALDGADTRVYQIDGQDLTAFMIVGNKVDV